MLLLIPRVMSTVAFSIFWSAMTFNQNSFLHAQVRAAEMTSTPDRNSPDTGG
ncbi:hypothetical protein BH10PSE10_BH10PSE10_11480 [soil metagenome]